ncbi:Nuclear factor of kappa light polypeptide protein enhancer in B-cells inhibitor-like 1 [Cichlidogyrus casuarinus]|uniref:NF-kappa-B inhibitor-like protein 1 n=1 Tax=Cichlidogyrus casuarinus TaxID=1844966 RepID=A0ABD2QHJ8_9PLAT
MRESKKRKKKHDFKAYLRKQVKKNKLVEMKSFLDRVSSDIRISREMLVDCVEEGSEDTLLHVACKHQSVQVLDYLLELGLTDRENAKGDYAIHVLMRHSSQAQFLPCCRMLSIMLRADPDLLYVRDHSGMSTLGLLEKLWIDAEPTHRRFVDRLLYKYVDHGSEHVPSTGVEDSAWNEKLTSALDEDYEEEMHSADYDPGGYYAGFVERDTRSHLDTIRDQYEAKRRRVYPQERKPEPGKNVPPLFNTAPTYNEMYGTGSSKPVGQDLIKEMVAHQQAWTQFLGGEAKVMAIDDIPWPPKIFSMEDHENLVNKVSKLVKEQGLDIKVLRQLQIDYHPDRFKNKIHPRISDTADQHLLPSVSAKVLLISQNLNRLLTCLKTNTVLQK